MNVFTKISDLFFNKFKPNQQEQLFVDVLKEIFEQSDTEFITAPISGKYYASNKRLGFYVKIADTAVTITNHKFTYVQQSSLAFNEFVIAVVREYMERDREEFEKKVFQNEMNLLNNIKESLKKNSI
jgi:hypothetical protein